MQSDTRKMLSKTTSSGETAFPWKLHMVLEESIFEGFDDIISWIGNNAFKVHDPVRFEESVMRRFFNQTQYKSFQRQRKFIDCITIARTILNIISHSQRVSFTIPFHMAVNIYGFKRVKAVGKVTGSYTHPLFIRGNPDACCYMVRVKVKKKGIRKTLISKISKESRTKNNIIESQSFDKFLHPIEYFSSPLHRRFKSLNESLANNGIIEPTPLPRRSVSPSSATDNNNGIIEPTPFRIDSMGASNNSKTMATDTNTILSNMDVVPCDSSNYSDRESVYTARHDSVLPMRFSIANSNTIGMVPIQEPEQHHHYQKCRCNNAALDLENMFDDDNWNKRNMRASTGSADPSFLNPFAMNNASYDQYAHMMVESLSNRKVDSY